MAVRLSHEFTMWCRRMSRRHWLLLVVLGCGAVLRAVVMLAYQPAFIFPDSERYLQYAQNFTSGQWSPDWLRTSGYSLLLIPAVLLRNLTVVSAGQHVLGLATAVLIYAVLQRFGVRAWIAALATVPVLFDPLQLVVEHYVLTDASATFLLIAALVVLVWNRGEVSKLAAAAAGLLLAAATLIREPDLVMAIPAAGYLVAAVRSWRRLAVRGGLLLAAFLLPVLGYLGWYQAARGQFTFVSYNSEFMYGRIAQFADCTGVSMPAYERALCPAQPPSQRWPDFYMWDPRSPQVTIQPPPGVSKEAMIGDFNRRIVEHQPLAYLEAVARDVLYGFSPVRGDGPERYPVAYLQFRPYFQADQPARTALGTYNGTGAHAEAALASFLTGYGRFVYTPGPLLAAGLAAGVAGMAGLGRRARRCGLRAPCTLFTLGAVATIVPPFLIATFDWRYELPELALIPAAAVLGVSALLGRGHDHLPGHDESAVQDADLVADGVLELGVANLLGGEGVGGVHA
jgi:Dolichyl-phosphate-mannose-protein mannosyltransferase